MSLSKKIAEFKSMCNALNKNAQAIDMTKPFKFNQELAPASLSGPVTRITSPYIASEVPSSNVHDLPDAKIPGLSDVVTVKLKDFANKLANFNAANWSGASVNEEDMKKAGAKLSSAINSNNLANIIQSLKEIQSLSNDGGGAILEEAKDLLVKVQAAKPQSAKPTWLDSYMAKEKKSPAWLDQYMAKQNDGKEEADSDIAGMQASLNNGPAVKVY